MDPHSIARIVCPDIDGALAENVIEWIKHLLSHPDQKPATGLLIVGNPEVSTFIEAIGQHIAPENILHSFAPRADLSGPRMQNAKLVIIHEPNLADMNIIKRTISQDSFTLIQLFQHPIEWLLNHHIIVICATKPEADLHEFIVVETY